MTPASCQVCDFRANEHGQHCRRCLGGKFLHSNRCRDDCDGLEGLIAYVPGHCKALFGRIAPLSTPPRPLNPESLLSRSILVCTRIMPHKSMATTASCRKLDLAMVSPKHEPDLMHEPSTYGSPFYATMPDLAILCSSYCSGINHRRP